MDSYGWLLDPKRCIECRACETACKQWNKVETGVNVRRRRVRVNEVGVWPQVSLQALSLSCQHCENALCMRVCPVKAITRRPDGIVVNDPDTCVGCRQCAMFCPYAAPQYHKLTGKMQKCTMCSDRIDQGLAPACASTCPTGALQWGRWDELMGRGVAQVPNFNTPNTTRPRIRFQTGEFGAR